MPQFKVLHGLGHESIVEAETLEEAKAQIEADGSHVAEITEYTPDYGQTVILGSGVYGGRWGFGPDLAAAKKAFRKNGGVLGKAYQIYEFDTETDFVGVTPMGVVTYRGTPPTTTEIQPVGKKKEHRS